MLSRISMVWLLAGLALTMGVGCTDSEDPSAGQGDDADDNGPGDNGPGDNDPAAERQQIETCIGVCDDVAACPEFDEQCGPDVVSEALSICEDACVEDAAARSQIIAFSGLPCSQVVAVAISSFGLTDQCGALEDPCDEITCDPPNATCFGNTAVNYTGQGTCVMGFCDFDAVQQREDCGDLTCDGGICLNETGDDVSIYAIQDTSDPSHPSVDSTVTVNNVIVTANSRSFLFVQEPDGGPFSGIFVEEGDLDISSLTPGTRVDIVGTYTENAGAFGIEGLSTINATSITQIASDNPPEPQPVAITDIDDEAGAEPFEGVLIRVVDLQVTDANPDGPDEDFGEFVVNDAMRVDDLLFAIDPDPVAGATMDSISGILNFSFTNFKILPRSAADVVGYETIDPCEQVTCPSRDIFCDGNDIVTTNGEGTCNLGECDYSAVETRQGCGFDACVGGECVPASDGALLISEVFYDVDGSDNGTEWVELFNGTDTAIDLSGFSLGYGGLNNTNGTYQLSGTIEPGGCIVVGGATSNADNGDPVYDLAQDFRPDLQNSGNDADVVGLYNAPANVINADSTPIDAVIYGAENTNGLLDETGNFGAVDVDDAPEGQSIERVSLTQWVINPTPNPNNCNVITP